MIMNSFSNALIMNISAPNLSSNKEQIEDIIRFSNYFKDTLEKNQYHLDDLGNGEKDIFSKMMTKLISLRNSENLENMELLYDNPELERLLNDFYCSSISDLLLHGYALDKNSEEKTLITVIFYKMSDNEIQSLIKF